jgi:cytohesin
LLWLLDHGADPNVRCGREQETSLHLAVRRGQHADIVRLLLKHGADATAPRGDGRTPWVLAKRGAHDELALILEAAGAVPSLLSPDDLLLAACARGEAEEARRLAASEDLAALVPEDFHLLPEAASKGRPDVVAACLAAGFPVNAADQYGATALHHAGINGRAAMVRELLRNGADFRISDPDHNGTAIGWVCFGADHFLESDGDYEGSARALLEAGARPAPNDYRPKHKGVRQVLRTFESR